MTNKLNPIVEVILAVAVICAIAIGAAGIFRHPIKHTGPCVFMRRDSTQCYWFVRPNRESFEMCFDNPPNVMVVAQSFDDVTYVDDNADFRHLLKFTFAKEPIKF